MRAFRSSPDDVTLLLSSLIEEIRQLRALLAEDIRLRAQSSPPAPAQPKVETPVEPKNGQLLTAAEAAKLLSVPVPHIYDLVKRGDLKGVKIGGYVRIDKSHLQKWQSRQAG